jgi:hypothetical protein
MDDALLNSEFSLICIYISALIFHVFVGPPPEMGQILNVGLSFTQFNLINALFSNSSECESISGFGNISIACLAECCDIMSHILIRHSRHPIMSNLTLNCKTQNDFDKLSKLSFLVILRRYRFRGTLQYRFAFETF